MTLRRFARSTQHAARTGAGLALLALLAVGIAATNTDAVVAGRFTAALEAAPRHAPVEVASGPDQPLISGSEAYWLEKRRHESGEAAVEPAAWSAPVIGSVAVGSRITISNGKDAHVLEVVSVSDVLPAPGASAPANGRTERKIAITCRDLSTPDGQLLTFETSLGAGPAARSPRAL